MTEPSDKTPLDEFNELIADRESKVNLWADALPALRAQSSASAAVLNELAEKTPGNVQTRPGGVDLMLVAPEMAPWVRRVFAHLREAFPDERSLRNPPIEMQRLPDNSGWPQPPRTIKAHLDIKDAPDGPASRRVQAALAELPDVDVDYSEPLDLLVVTPSVPRP
jgi:hypothetical protein